MVLIYKQIQTKIAIITEDKVTEIFCMADDFCKLIMILFHDSGYRCFKHFCITIRSPLAIKCVKSVLDGVTYTYLFYGYNTPPPTLGSEGKL